MRPKGLSIKNLNVNLLAALIGRLARDCDASQLASQSGRQAFFTNLNVNLLAALIGRLARDCDASQLASQSGRQAFFTIDLRSDGITR
jgi:DNA-binding phage protein